MRELQDLAVLLTRVSASGLVREMRRPILLDLLCEAHIADISQGRPQASLQAIRRLRDQPQPATSPRHRAAGGR